MKRNNKENEIDIKSWIFKFRSRWYLFLIFGIFSMAAAYVYIKSSQRIYKYHSTLLLGDQRTGSKKAQELLDILQVQDKGIKVEDEIGLIQSTDMVKRAVQRMDYYVSYFKVTDHWLNNISDLVIEEQYKTAPYEVLLDTASVQLVDVPFEITLLPDNKYQLTVKGEDVARYDYGSNTILEFIPEVDFTKTLTLGEPYKDKYISLTVVRPEDREAVAPTGKKNYFVLNSLESQVGYYQSTLAVAPLERESRVLVLSGKGSIPEKGMFFLNTLMEEYVLNDLNEKNMNGRKTLDFIDQQLAVLADSLRNSKQALSSYRSNHRIANIGTQSTLEYERLSQLESEKAKINTDRIIYNNILDQIRNGEGIANSVSPNVAGVSNPNLTNLFSDLARLNSEKAGYGVNATQDNPVLKRIESNIESTKGAIVANLENLIRSSEISLKDVDRRINEIESSLARVPENERRLMDLQSEADFVSKKYDFMLEKRGEAAISLATNTTDKKIVDRASLSSAGPINVKPNMIYMLAILIGLAIPAGFVVLLENIDNTIQGKNDLTRLTNIPFLGIIAHGSKSDKLAVYNNTRSAIAESFRSIRVNLQYLLGNEDAKVIGITSSVSGEGKTFCSVNLSSELALSGKRVVLIESDMRKPTFDKYFNTHNSAGLSTYLQEDVHIEDVLQSTIIENLDIIPCGPVPENAIQLLETPKMQALMTLLRDRYDYIVIDTPPIGYVSEYFILMKHTDTNLYVVKYKYTDKELLNQINELYTSKKLKNVFIVMNDLDYSKTYEYSYKKKGNYYYA